MLTQQIIKRPGDGLLAALLGVAIGVMATLSVLEMYIHNAMENGWAMVTTCVVAGASLYYIVQPYLPDFEPLDAASGGAAAQVRVAVGDRQLSSSL